MTGIESHTIGLLSCLLNAQNLQLHKAILEPDVWRVMTTAHLDACNTVLACCSQLPEGDEEILSPTEQDPTVDGFLTFLKSYFERPTAKSKVTIAREAEISRVYLHNLIEGKKPNPSLGVAIRLALAMGTTLEKVLTDGCRRQSAILKDPSPTATEEV